MKASSVLIVGAGGLGCPAGIYLAAAGIGNADPNIYFSFSDEQLRLYLVG